MSEHKDLALAVVDHAIDEVREQRITSGTLADAVRALMAFEAAHAAPEVAEPAAPVVVAAKGKSVAPPASSKSSES